MSEVIGRNNNIGQLPVNAQLITKAGALIAAGSLAFNAPSAASQDAYKATAKELNVAAALESRIVRGETVRFEPEFDLYGPDTNRDSDDYFDTRTRVPLKANVDGARRFFDIVQIGHSLKSLRVRPLNPNVVAVQSRYDDDFHCNINPTKRGIVKLNRNSQPVVALRYGNIKRTTARVGKTTPYNRSSIMVPSLEYPQNC